LGVSVAIVCIVALFCVSCERSDSTPEGAIDSRNEGDSFSVENARNAILDMIDSPSVEYLLKCSRDVTKEGPVTRKDDDRVAIGPWEIDLGKRTFTCTIVNPPQLFFQQEGHFVQNKAGEWKALVDKTTRN